MATFIAGIRGTTTVNMDAVPVVIHSAGQLGTVSSSARFKREIKPMDKASEAILVLKPVIFHYKSDNTNTAQFGLIAEQVANTNPELVMRDENGEIYTVRYEAVNVMLLNEFLKEYRKVEEQGARLEEQGRELQEQKAINAELRSTVAQQNKGMQSLAEQVRAQNARIEKVTAQIATGAATSQVAENRHHSPPQ